MDQFLKQFNPDNKRKVDRAQLYELIEEIIVPQNVFQARSSATDPLEVSFVTLMDTLREEKTRVGTDLEEWAMKFLTADSLILAVQVIEKFKVQGKSFLNYQAKIRSSFYKQQQILSSTDSHQISGLYRRSSDFRCLRELMRPFVKRY